jgi:hypothetical protein
VDITISGLQRIAAEAARASQWVAADTVDVEILDVPEMADTYGVTPAEMVVDDVVGGVVVRAPRDFGAITHAWFVDRNGADMGACTGTARVSDGMPPKVARAIDELAEWATSRARKSRPDFAHFDDLRDWIAGSVEAQLTDPDYSQAADMATTTEGS